MTFEFSLLSNILRVSFFALQIFSFIFILFQAQVINTLVYMPSLLYLTNKLTPNENYFELLFLDMYHFSWI